MPSGTVWPSARASFASTSRLRRRFAAAGISSGAADRVLMNPPFNAGAEPVARSRPPAGACRPLETLRRWVRYRRVASAPGRRSDADLARRRARCGAGGARRRFRRRRRSCRSIRSRRRRRSGCWCAPSRQSRAPLAVLPGLVLTDGDGQPTPAAEAILREGAVLALAESPIANPLIPLRGTTRKGNVGGGARPPRSDARGDQFARHRRGGSGVNTLAGRRSGR